MSNFDREVSRRKFLQYAGLGGAVLVLGGLEVIALKNRDKIDPPTEEQKKAKKLLEQIVNPQMPILTVTGDMVGNERKAYFRDKPRVPADKGDLRAGSKEGSLKIGSKVERWIVVSGNDEDYAMDDSRRDRWVAFMRGDRAVFSHRSLFDDLNAINSAPLVDLSKV